MKQFVVSLTSFSIVALVVWSAALMVALGVNTLESWGLPAPFAWVGVGAAVVVCKPGAAIVEFSSYIYSRVDVFFWRMF